MTFHSCRNEMFIPFLQEWNGVIPFLQEWSVHSIPAGMECSFHSCRNGMTPFHSCRNGMSIPFQPEWWGVANWAKLDYVICARSLKLSWFCVDFVQKGLSQSHYYLSKDPDHSQCWHCTADTAGGGAQWVKIKEHTTLFQINIWNTYLTMALGPLC